MKQLLTLCLLGILSLSTYAQTKPSKQQTLDYLDKTLKMAVGYTSYKYKATTYRLEGATLYPTEIRHEIRSTNSETDKTYVTYEQYSNIKWEDLKDVVIDKDPEEMDAELTNIFVRFNTKLRYDAQAHGNDVGMSDDMHYPNGLKLYVLKSKAESVKKALARLSEIAKEENKDLF